ncbi:hypothetical protein B0H11DRAFT_2083783, partial [Mycena galericulata]
MSKCHCNVCWSDLSIEDFGGWHVDTVSVQLAQVDYNVCHALLVPSAARRSPWATLRSFTSTLWAVKPLESVVADGISLMDQDSKLVSVRTAERKLRQVAEQPRVDPAALDSLLAAIDDFNKRIVPIFTRVKSQQTEIASLKTQNAEMAEIKVQAEKATTLSGEVAILRAERLDLRKVLQKANAERDLALELAEKGKAQVVELRGKAEAAEGDAQAEIRRLKGYLERNAEDRLAQRAKIQSLQHERDSLEQQVEDLRSELRTHRGPGASSSYTEDLEIEDEIFTSQYSQSSPRQASSQSTRGSHIHAVWHTQDSLALTLDFEGMPRPGFGTDWQLDRGTKRKARDTEPPPPGFPIAISKGRTTTAVQLGPKHTRRVKV